MSEEREAEEMAVLGEIPDDGIVHETLPPTRARADPRSGYPVDALAKAKGEPFPKSFENDISNMNSIALPAKVTSTFDTRPINTYDFLASGIVNLT